MVFTMNKNYIDGNYEIATVAGGCFWCIESAFENVEGVIEAVSGYTGGEEEDPTYEEVSSGETGHMEAVQVRFDPAVISYEKILEIFWHQIDPTDPDGQFADRGPQYRTAIFYHDEAQRETAERTKKAFAAEGKFARRIATKILPAKEFYYAEDYHQGYWRLNLLRYKSYREGSGRARYLRELWGTDRWGEGVAAKAEKKEYVKPTETEIKKKLTPKQYEVTQREGTEKAFDNEYWDNHRDGIYVDVVSGEPLFSSRDKFDSGTGWPSFTKPLEPENIVERTDRKLFTPRTEVRSRNAGSHLGHVFDDGPAPTGKRFCLNSASLRFIPKEDLENEGYGEYLKLFENKE
jgi:peptide methionine sulfoxide reductase msrA/msrB